MFPKSYATCSIGMTAQASLQEKLDAISHAGFDGIELAFPDLLAFAKSHLKRDVEEDDYPSLCEAARVVKSLCRERKLTILVLQPFSNFEGWPQGSAERQQAFDKARGWIEIMRSVGTDMLQVGASDSVGISQDVAGDLRELADLLAAHSFRLAYENWCWATNAPTWEKAWETVQQVDRDNVGLCLDTFQIAGSAWADPTVPSGLGENHLQESLRRLATVPKDQIFFLQISDAYRMDPPLDDHSVDGLRPKGRWSHDHRPLPFDGGYLPVVEVMDAMRQTGFTNWISMEVFDSRTKWANVEEEAQAAMKACKSLLR